jgi:hypothetical protein
MRNASTAIAVKASGEQEEVITEFVVNALVFKSRVGFVTVSGTAGIVMNLISFTSVSFREFGIETAGIMTRNHRSGGS